MSSLVLRSRVLATRQVLRHPSICWKIINASLCTGAQEQAWDKLSSSVQQIFAKNASSLSFEENYRHAYNLVVSKNGAMLYDGLTSLVTQNLNTLAKEKLVPEFPRATLDGRDTVEICQEGETFIKAFREVWDDHDSSMSKISDLVKYMVSYASFPKQ
jgi:cullin 3